MAVNHGINLSVLVPTFNPQPKFLTALLKSLQIQTYELTKWELIIIDNNSDNGVLQAFDFSWHPHFSLVKELKQGLTYSRARGFRVAKGACLVMVDDDNELGKDYLKNTVAILEANPKMGAIGGKSLPVFETEPPVWLKEFHANLALRDMGDEVLIESWQNLYPSAAPIGAGMGIRKEAIGSYQNKIEHVAAQAITDRVGNSLSSGGDNDIVIEILKSGWQVGYFPQLLLFHHIPQQRMEVSYLARLLNNSNKSWVQVLAAHKINPWKKVAKASLPFRKLKAWFAYKAWQNEVNYIKWQGACGLFDGLSLLK